MQTGTASSYSASWIPADGTFSFSNKPGNDSYVKYGYIAYRTPKDPKDLNLIPTLLSGLIFPKGEGPAIYDAASGAV